MMTTTTRKTLTLKKSNDKPNQAEDNPQKEQPSKAKKPPMNFTKETIDYFEKKYPDALSFKNPQKPLQVRIHQALIKENKTIHPVICKKFLSAYVKNPNYLKLILTQTDRYNLAGEPVAKITPEQKSYTESVLAAREAKKREKKVEIKKKPDTKET